jgi:uncharacterized protein (TIGR03083 family)
MIDCVVPLTRMAGPTKGVVMTEWNFFDFASKDNMLRTIARQSDAFLSLVSDPSRWESPTAAGHWQVRDVVGHLVETTEGYFSSFEAARGGQTPVAALGLKEMNKYVDEGALAFRSVRQNDLVGRLRADRDKMLSILQGLDSESWAGFMAPHKYLGPVPACVYAAGQLVDYTVHAWDIRQGTGRAHALEGDAADLLVPFALIVWQSTAVCEGDPFTVGIRVTGKNSGDTRMSISPDGCTMETDDATDLPCVLEFDPASLVLTAYGRTNAGTVRGDAALAERFTNVFFRI